jgi:hypothetical protein
LQSRLQMAPVGFVITWKAGGAPSGMVNIVTVRSLSRLASVSKGYSLCAV